MSANILAVMKEATLEVLLGIGLKFMLGSDDLIWLAPFMAKCGVRQKFKMAFKYVLSVMFLSSLAVILATVLVFAAKSGGGEEIAQKVIGTVAGAFLAFYSFYMAREEGYFHRCGGPSGDEEDEEEELTAGHYGALLDDGAAPDDGGGGMSAALSNGLVKISDCVDMIFCCGEEEEEEADAVKKRGLKRAQKNIIVVAFCGCMDDFMIYFTLALSGKLSMPALLVGTFIGAILIALIVGCLLEACKPLADCVETIPVPAVILLLSVYIILSAWVPAFDV